MDSRDNSRNDSRNKAIADAADCGEVAGLGWIFFDVAAEADNKIVDGTSVGVFVQAPYVFEDGFARNGIAFIANEVTKEFGFHQGELDGGVVRAEFKIIEIDCFAIERKYISFGVRDFCVRIFGFIRRRLHCLYRSICRRWSLSFP